MKNSYLALICGVILFIILSMSWCQPRSTTTQVAGSPTPSPSPTTTVPTVTAAVSPQASVSPTPVATASVVEPASAELRKAASKTAPAVVLLTVFDVSGKLLRTGTGFFVSSDGRFITSRNLVDGGANAIVTTADKKIYNVIGVLAESPELDLAIGKAETKQVPFLPLDKVTALETGARVAVVGSPLSGREATETKIAATRSDEKGEWLDLPDAPANEVSGSPVVSEKGEVVGMITPNRTKNPPTNDVLSVNVLQAFAAKVEPTAAARWAAAPTPSPTPKPRKGKIVFNPPPVYPSNAYNAAIRGSGSYRIVFDAAGNAKNVQVLRSTGSAPLDRAAVTALQQWKSEPGPEWNVTVPITFQPKAN